MNKILKDYATVKIDKKLTGQLRKRFCSYRIKT